MPSLNRRSALGLAGLGLAGGGLGWYLTGSAAGSVQAPDQRPAVDRRAIETLATDTGAFGLDLLGVLAKRSPERNVAFSPLGLAIPLVIASEGARGETAHELQETLSMDLNHEQLHAAIGALLYDLDEDTSEIGGRNLPRVWERTRFDLGVGTALWGQEGFPFREEFLDTVERNYGPAFRTADFSADPGSARRRINDWIADTTDGAIEETLPQNAIDDLTRLVIANVVYLFADWATPFDPDDTDEQSFASLDGTESTVQMMHQTEEVPVAILDDGDDRTKAVELPYVGDTTSMVCLLPPEGRFRAYEYDLDAAGLAEVFDALSEREVRISLPRFTFDTELELSPILEELGVSAAFDCDRADFDGLVRSESVPEFCLDELYNETVVTVDEEGTEAVSVSVGIGGFGSRRSSITFDRPFLFVIRDRETDTPLFLGRVVDGETL